MSMVQLNLDANTYSDEQLRQKFRLAPDYTKDNVDVATRRLLETAKTNLGGGDLQMFRQFVNDAKERLMRHKAPEYVDDVGALLPTDRQLTTLPPPNPTSASLAPPAPPPPQTEPQPMPTSSPWRDMKNRTHRVVHIDSQYRQNISTINADGSAGTSGAPTPTSNAFNTDFTLDLSEPLSNVLEMKLHAYHIPTTWYNFDSSLGNTKFSVNGVETSIDDGNYTIDQLCTMIQTKSTATVTVSYNEETNKITLAGADFIFYDRTGTKGSDLINQNLGWALGFRQTLDTTTDVDGTTILLDTITINGSKTDTDGNYIGVTADVPPCMLGPKYFVLSIDDYNQTQQNRGLILATDDHGPVNTVRPPRMPTSVTTKAQLASQTALIARAENPNKRITPPQTPNAFATILFTDIGDLRPDPLVKVSSSLHVYSRAYNGPIDIERLRVRLFDDKGNLVNLNDNDWSFSLLFEQLY